MVHVSVPTLEKLCKMELVLVLLTRLCKMVLVLVGLLIFDKDSTFISKENFQILLD